MKSINEASNLLTDSVIKKGIINLYFFILLAEKIFRAGKNDFRASRC